MGAGSRLCAFRLWPTIGGMRSVLSLLVVLIVIGADSLTAADAERELGRLLGRMHPEHADQRASLVAQLRAADATTPPKKVLDRLLRARASALQRLERGLARPASAVVSEAAASLEPLRAQALAAIRGSYQQARVDAAVAQLRAHWGVNPDLAMSVVAELAEEIATVDELDRYLAGWSAVTPPEPLGGASGVTDVLDRLVKQGLMPRGAAAVIAHNDSCTYLSVGERANLRVLNDYRAMLGLNLVASDVRLYSAAKMHSYDMATRGFFSHDSPVPGRGKFTARARLHGATASSENIQVGTTDGAVAFDRWYHSAGHHKNMVGNWSHLGVGLSGSHWTQKFGAGSDRPGAALRGEAALRAQLLAAQPQDDWADRLQRVAQAAQAGMVWVPGWELARIRTVVGNDTEAAAAIARVEALLAP